MELLLSNESILKKLYEMLFPYKKSSNAYDKEMILKDA